MVECARLEIWFTRKRNVGSNPTLSANNLFKLLNGIVIYYSLKSYPYFYPSPRGKPPDRRRPASASWFCKDGVETVVPCSSRASYQAPRPTGGGRALDLQQWLG